MYLNTIIIGINANSIDKMEFVEDGKPSFVNSLMAVEIIDL